MRQEMVIHGVPDSIRMDAWWLGAEAQPDQQQARARQECRPLLASLRMRHAVPLLGLLVVIADWLFWAQPVGISLAVFSLILSGVILALRPVRPCGKEWAGAAGFALLCNLPLAISLQLVPVLFSLGGVVCLAVWAVYGRDSTAGLALRAAGRLAAAGLTLLIRKVYRSCHPADLGSGARRQAASLLLPALMGTVFLGLLTSANPLLEDFLAELDPGRLLEPSFWLRIAFWCVTAALLWPYLNLGEVPLGGAARIGRPKAGPSRASFLINPGSVRNSLLLFNLLFLVQTAMDTSILTGSVTLPNGMSYAEYAHRGAYPLVVTAVLAGVFTLVSHRMIGASRGLRVLIYLWLAQNMFLVVTAAIRLQYYVNAYALTYLRIAAFIWMALVLAGLLLTVVQIRRGHGTAWLLQRSFAALLGTLYICCFVNFAEVIASYNLRHASALTARDTSYICSLGTDAFPAIHAFEAQTGQRVCGRAMIYRLRREAGGNWREWGFRSWRVQAYYQQQI